MSSLLTGDYNMTAMLPGSSTVERLPVKEWVVGSNPTRGALIEIEQEIARFPFYSLGFLRFEPWQSLAWTRVRRFSSAQANFLRKH